MCRTPVAFAASTAFRSSSDWFSAFGPEEEQLVTALKRRTKALGAIVVDALRPCANNL